MSQEELSMNIIAAILFGIYGVIGGVLLSGIVQSICPKLREHLYEKEVTKTVDIVIMAVLLFLCTMYLVSSTYNPFIYFRF